MARLTQVTLSSRDKFMKGVNITGIAIVFGLIVAAGIAIMVANLMDTKGKTLLDFVYFNWFPVYLGCAMVMPVLLLTPATNWLARRLADFILYANYLAGGIIVGSLIQNLFMDFEWVKLMVAILFVLFYGASIKLSTTIHDNIYYGVRRVYPESVAYDCVELGEYIMLKDCKLVAKTQFAHRTTMLYFDPNSKTSFVGAVPQTSEYGQATTTYEWRITDDDEVYDIFGDNVLERLHRIEEKHKD